MQFDCGDRVALRLLVEFSKDCSAPIFGLAIKTPDGVTVYGNNSRDVSGGPFLHPVTAGTRVVVVPKLELLLGEGDHMLSVGVAEDDGSESVPKDRRYDARHIQVLNRSKSQGLTELGMRCSITTVGGVEVEVAG